jgi:glutamate carboxypeptidase
VCPMGTLDLTALQQAVEALRPRFLEDLAALVNLDCGSHDKVGVDAAGRLVQTRLESDGWTVERLPDTTWGDTLVASIDGGAGPAHVVLMAHLDTVFDSGTAAQRPFRTDGTTAHGPGVTDCKGGLLAGVTAVAALKGAGVPFGRLTFLLTPDEEVGSPSSRLHIQTHAAGADAALCLECARANGDIVKARKGVVDLVIEIEGRAAHAGVEPEKGINAALDAAATTVALQALNGRWPGVTVNVGVIRAGSRPNVICPDARLEVDVRAVELGTFEEATGEVERVAAQVHVPGVLKTVIRAATHAPMEPTADGDALATIALKLAAELGITTSACATGGAADANTTSSMGIPTLDGLGPVGGNDHSPAEFLDLASITPRTTLLAALIAELTAGGL